MVITVNSIETMVIILTAGTSHWWFRKSATTLKPATIWQNNGLS